jgi:hypothetical protein
MYIVQSSFNFCWNPAPHLNLGAIGSVYDVAQFTLAVNQIYQRGARCQI